MSVVVGVLAFGAIVCGFDAIVSDSATIPSKHGDGKRVQGTDTILVGIGWLLMGLGLTAKIVLRPPGGHAGTVTAVVLIVTGALFWYAAV